MQNGTSFPSYFKGSIILMNKTITVSCYGGRFFNVFCDGIEEAVCKQGRDARPALSFVLMGPP